jgi:hypothetical protein
MHRRLGDHMEVSHISLKRVGAITLTCANHVIINHADNT